MALMIHIKEEDFAFQLPLVGHCTDSAANSLSGLVKLASPSTYTKVCEFSFIGLPSENYVVFLSFHSAKLSFHCLSMLGSLS